VDLLQFDEQMLLSSYLGIHICNVLCAKALVDIKQDRLWGDRLRLQIGYGKVVANRGRYSRRALARLYSTFCDHSVLFTSGIYPLLQKKQLKSIRVMYFWYLEYLIYLPRSYRNQVIVSKYGVTDITQLFERLKTVLADSAAFPLGCFYPLIRLFCR